MKQLLNKEDVAELLLHKHLILLTYVDWSADAADARSILAYAERFFAKQDTDCEVDFWIADTSTLESPGMYILDWVMEQNLEDIRKHQAIGAGYGSVFWIKHGELIDYELKAANLGKEEFLEKTINLFRVGVKRQ